MDVPNGIKGVIVPILTPLTDDETVDTGSLRRLVNYLIDSGAHGIWAAGTTGEFAALPDAQRLLSIETVVDEVAGRVPVIGNISASATQLTVDLGLSVQEMGLAGIAATPPYYYPCAQDELLDHFRYIRDRVGLPLWIYNIPITVKTVVEPTTIATLAAEGTVAGIKDSSGAGELLAHLNVLCDTGNIDLLRFIGTVFRIGTTGAVGAHGVIPSIANLATAVASESWEAGEAGDVDTARRLQGKVAVASKVTKLAKGGGPNAATLSGMKSALKIMGIIDNDTLTRPLRGLTQEEKQQIPPILEELGLPF
jgi:4-hydroxy-tetrahydrodipicolinate synthase